MGNQPTSHLHFSLQRLALRRSQSTARWVPRRMQFLALLAGLSFGLLAALLMESTTGNKFLDAFGIGALLALLGSAIGYDGAQLILLAILPSFAFAIAAVMPSRVAAAILTGLLAAAGLIFFDPTELTIVLGDIVLIATRAVSLAVGLGLAVGLIALLIRSMTEAGTMVREDAGARSRERGRGLGRRHYPFLYDWQSRFLR